ncbi:uncharacterized protein LOC122505687 [Leptopilina heterotoma]|uniref:uncharacterized protein LOC122505687 n=1 Tax=Leptopilina heterotoma TaxID=63436 RepID=UPI001CA96DEB|nr:uncharacterized protein LOC122505687 [Leptopilina heterotoma]
MAHMVLQIKPFQLVQFISPGKRSVTKSIDITLLKWMRFDEKKKKFVTKYMPPPYNDETSTILYDLIHKQGDVPDDSWPEYPIQIHGHADTFEMAVMRLNQLKIDKFAYTESETEPKKKKKMTEDQIKNKLQSLSSLDDILNVSDIVMPTPGDTESANSSISTSIYRKPENPSSSGKQPAILPNSKKGRNSSTLAEKSRKDSFSSDDSITENGERIKPKNNSKFNVFGSRMELDESLDNDSDDVEFDREGFAVNQISLSQSDRKKNTVRNFAEHSYRADKNRKSVSNSGENKLPAKEKDYFKFLVKEIKSLRLDVQNVRDNTNIVIGMIEQLANLNHNDQKCFEQQYELNLPLQTLEELEKLNQLLLNNEVCNKHFKASVKLTLNKDIGVRKTLNLLIKKFCGREVVLQLTSSKTSPGKIVFKTMAFCSSLIDVATEKFEISEEAILAHLGVIFGNAKDWDGHRKQRKEKHSDIL